MIATTRALIATVLLAACGPSSGDGAPDATPRDGGGSAIDASPPVDAAPLVDVDVVITADNAYSFGYGDIDEIDTYFPGTRAITASLGSWSSVRS